MRWTLPDDVVAADRFGELARITEQRWIEAYDFSSAITYRWLPAPEQKMARQASALLATAADAARKAGQLLTRITSIVLPRATLAAVDHRARLAIESGADRPAP